MKMKGIGFWWNAGFYAFLMIGFVGALVYAAIAHEADISPFEILIGTVLTALTFGFKSAVEAQVERMRRDDNLPILTDTLVGGKNLGDGE